MPFSLPILDDEVKEIVSDAKYHSFLDIGPGEGKYGKMIRAANPGAHIEGVEVDASYIKEYELEKIYDKVHNVDINHFIDNEPSFRCDVAIIGDCIEHLRKSDGLDLINYLAYRAHLIIVKFPVELVQYDWQGHASEAHRSVWEEDDFRGFKYTYKKDRNIRLVVISGYLKLKTAA